MFEFLPIAFTAFDFAKSFTANVFQIFQFEFTLRNFQKKLLNIQKNDFIDFHCKLETRLF